ncbi:unnamed protein product [Urochloa decumbens]|uniref:NB-ARC domain-containing protein n=1 Tax=Urochloa decumbens TaxID=240449 RepID=A0ABC9B2I9_9POAL
MSPSFDLVDTMRYILKSIEVDCPVEARNLDFLQRSLYDALQEKRPLVIVLDDVWIQNEQERENLHILLAPLRHAMFSESYHCRIIITTRDPIVAHYFTTIEPSTKSYFLRPLKQELSTQFIHQWVGTNSSNISSNDLQELCTGIADICCGVPFLLERARRILAQGSIPLSLQNFEEDFRASLRKNDGFSRVNATFENLPPELQRCILHCTLFPTNYDFDVEELADHLASQGLISRTEIEVERPALFQQLLDECFRRITDSQNDSKSLYRMYWIMHVYAQQRSGSAVRADKATPYADRSNEYASLILDPTSTSFPSYLSGFKDLRTLVIVQRQSMSSVHKITEDNEHAYDLELIESLRRLRALSLRGMKIRRLPKNFDILYYLRYLNLSHTDIETIPKSISKLQFLRTLILSYCRMLQTLNSYISKLSQLQELNLQGCPYIIELPTDMNKLKSLKYLNLHECQSLTSMPRMMGQLTNLNTLLGFVVSSNKGSSISEVKSLGMLRRLSLRNLENISGPEEVGGVMLKDKDHLESLTLLWDRKAEVQENENRDDDVPPGKQSAEAEVLPMGNQMDARVSEIKHGDDSSEEEHSMDFRVSQVKHTMDARVSERQGDEILEEAQNMCLLLSQEKQTMGARVSERKQYHENLEEEQKMDIQGTETKHIMDATVSDRKQDDEILREEQNMDLLVPQTKHTTDSRVSKEYENIDAGKQEQNTSSNEDQILEGLEPNDGLKSLEIIGYPWKKLPSWMMAMPQNLGRLVEIRLLNLACEALPQLGLLPSLRTAEISGADAIRSINKDFYGSNGTFPSLQKLTLSYMMNLECWESAEHGSVFPLLDEVTIIQCPKLTLDVKLPALTKLFLCLNNTKLYSSKGGLGGAAPQSHTEELSTCLDGVGKYGLGRLRNLEIRDSYDMICLPEGLEHISTLRRLTIDSCSNLSSLPVWLTDLSSLRQLRLSGCPMLEFNPEYLLPRKDLKLWIEDCPKILRWPSGLGKENMEEEDSIVHFSDIEDDL